jgi:DNA repair protein RecN (Recombination protein N)
VQLELLDHYAGTFAARRDVSDAFRRWHDAAAHAAELEARIAAARDRRDLLRYQVGELEAIEPRAGEFEALDAQFRRLAKAEEISRTLGEAEAALSGESDSGVAELARLARVLDGIDDRHAALDAARDLLRTALSHLDEVASELRRYAEAIDVAPEELKRIDDRLSQLHELARKHRLKPDELAVHLTVLKEELGRLDVGDRDVAALNEEAAEQKRRFVECAEQLSIKRRKAAKSFEAAVSKQMRELGIKGGALALEFSNAENETGVDAVEYFVTTNPKFPAGSLAQIASGGERSRISLAIQVVAAQKARLPALILDEADVGIGGATADAVGRLLQSLAEHAQVLCVTHSPQVAARGSQHLRVGKSKDGETFVETLARETRVAELARMLGGREITAKTLDLAEELIASGSGGR